MNFIGIIDLQFENLLFGIRSPFLISTSKTITFFGETSVIILLVAIGAAVLWSSPSARAYVVGLAAAVSGAGATSYLLKNLFERARPDGLIPAIVETSGSFPSGHATLSMAFYGFVAYFFCTRFPEKKLFITSIAVLIIGAIGASRLYLGVHFPSDVLAGYLLGGVWILIGIRLSKI